MKYLCLCYYNVQMSEALTPPVIDALSDARAPHYKAWETTGKLDVIGALSEPKHWKKIRPTDTNGDTDSVPIIGDGPYIDVDEHIGAFFFIEADDIEEAVQTAAKHPSAHYGRFLAGGIQVCPCEAYE